MIAGRRMPLAVTLGAGAGAAALILAAGGWLLAPTTGEQLSAAMGTADAPALARLAAVPAGGEAATEVLAARSLIAAGKADEALARLAPVAADHAGDPILIALMSEALAAAGRQEERLALLHATAAHTGKPADLRALRVVAMAANDAARERFALTRLGEVGQIDGATTERLAYLEERAGAGAAARARLAARWAAARAAMSVDATQRLLRLSLPVAEAATLADLVDALAARRAGPARAAVIDDLIALHRPQIALALIGDPAPPPLWRRRAELLVATHDGACARAMLAAAQAGTASPSDLVAVAYRLDAPDLIVAAAERGAIPRLSPALALDLARRLTAQPAMIARLDRVAGGSWRGADPWLAMRLAVAAGDRAQALHYAGLVAPDQRAAATEDLLTRFGDVAGLRAFLLDTARRNPAASAMLAERLLAIGGRDEATRLLQSIAIHPDDPATRRLLYLWGPRPLPPALAWLKQRAATATDADERLRWLTLYAGHDTPRAALRVLEGGDTAGQTAVLLVRLDLSAEAGDVRANERALRLLLDGRALSPIQLDRVTGGVLPAANRALRLVVAERRVAGGVALPADRMDIAWAAWNTRDLPAARTAVARQIAIRPDDAVALTLMADIETRQHGDRQARGWLQRALAATEGDSRAHATLLSRLGRPAEALAMTRRLRGTAPADRALIADEARLLIATGRPATAQALFQP